MIHANFNYISREEIVNTINDYIDVWYSVWGSEYSPKDYTLVEEDIVTDWCVDSDKWDDDFVTMPEGEGEGNKHISVIKLRSNAVLLTPENWAYLQQYVADCIDAKIEDLKKEFYAQAIEDAEFAEYSDTEFAENAPINTCIELDAKEHINMFKTKNFDKEIIKDKNADDVSIFVAKDYVITEWL